MPSALIRGSVLKRLAKKKKPVKVTRTQTAKEAVRAIRAKYGRVQDGAYYYHRGRGNWAKYDVNRDRKRKSKPTLPRDSKFKHQQDSRGHKKGGWI